MAPVSSYNAALVSSQEGLPTLFLANVDVYAFVLWLPARVQRVTGSSASGGCPFAASDHSTRT